MQKTEPAAPFGALSGLFFLSGIAGLIYQVCWQRLLFAAFGSDLTSITIVVSAFMAGLGLGALAGGMVADRYPARTLLLFTGCEGLIGIFGFSSPWLLRAAGDWFVGASTLVVALANFCLVLLPALMMGATLPILVAYLARLWRNVGRATGQLYAVNTLGAALGAMLPAFVLFKYINIDFVIYIAAGINLSVAALTFAVLRSRGEQA